MNGVIVVKAIVHTERSYIKTFDQMPIKRFEFALNRSVSSIWTTHYIFHRNNYAAKLLRELNKDIGNLSITVYDADYDDLMRVNYLTLDYTDIDDMFEQPRLRMSIARHIIITNFMTRKELIEYMVRDANCGVIRHLLRWPAINDNIDEFMKTYHSRYD